MQQGEGSVLAKQALLNEEERRVNWMPGMMPSTLERLHSGESSGRTSNACERQPSSLWRYFGEMIRPLRMRLNTEETEDDREGTGE